MRMMVTMTRMMTTMGGRLLTIVMVPMKMRVHALQACIRIYYVESLCMASARSVFHAGLDWTHIAWHFVFSARTINYQLTMCLCPTAIRRKWQPKARLSMNKPLSNIP